MIGALNILIATSFILRASSDVTLTQTFSYTGGVQTFVVPRSVYSITIEAYGGAGSGSNYQSTTAGYTCVTGDYGSNGAYYKSTFSVTPGTTYYVYVGGHSGSWEGGYNGGGSGAKCGGGGGGCSDVRTSEGDVSSRIIAAGGGGGGYNAGDCYGSGGYGGTDDGATGTEDSSCCPTDGPGKGGTQSAGGGEGECEYCDKGCTTYYGQDGSLGKGGDGIFYQGNGGGSNPGFGGGGGGCGHYGGGSALNGGGGGGSSFATGSSSSGSANVQSGDGKIIITFSAPDPTSCPSTRPSSLPSSSPSSQPSAVPSPQPSPQPSNHPSCQPSSLPSVQPSPQPSFHPSTQPSGQPSTSPSIQPSFQPSMQPSLQPSNQPSCQPSPQPTGQPSVFPSFQPTTVPTEQPSSQPTSRPTPSPTHDPLLFDPFTPVAWTAEAVAKKIEYFLGSYVAFFGFLYILLALLDLTKPFMRFADGLYRSADKHVTEVASISEWLREGTIVTGVPAGNAESCEENTIAASHYANKAAQKISKAKLRFNHKAKPQADASVTFYSDLFNAYVSSGLCYFGCEPMLCPEGMPLPCRPQPLAKGQLEDFLIYIFNNVIFLRCLFGVMTPSVNHMHWRMVYVVSLSIAFFLTAFTNSVIKALVDDDVSQAYVIIIINVVLVQGLVGLCHMAADAAVSFVFTILEGSSRLLCFFLVMVGAVGLLVLAAIFTESKQQTGILETFVLFVLLAQVFRQLFLSVIMFRPSFHVNISIKGLRVVTLGGYYHETLLHDKEKRHAFRHFRFQCLSNLLLVDLIVSKEFADARGWDEKLGDSDADYDGSRVKEQLGRNGLALNDSTITVTNPMNVGRVEGGGDVELICVPAESAMSDHAFPRERDSKFEFVVDAELGPRALQLRGRFHTQNLTKGDDEDAAIDATFEKRVSDFEVIAAELGLQVRDALPSRALKGIKNPQAQSDDELRDCTVDTVFDKRESEFEFNASEVELQRLEQRQGREPTEIVSVRSMAPLAVEGIAGHSHDIGEIYRSNITNKTTTAEGEGGKCASKDGSCVEQVDNPLVARNITKRHTSFFGRESYAKQAAAPDPRPLGKALRLAPNVRRRFIKSVKCFEKHREVRVSNEDGTDARVSDLGLDLESRESECEFEYTVAKIG